MAADGGRQYAQILKRIWADTDWKSLTRDAQWMYQLLLSQPSMNYAGVLPLTSRRWAKLAEDATIEVVEKAIERLHERGFLVVDWDTEEVLIRSFIRNDGLWKQPNMLTTALRHADDVSSDHIKWALHDELLRIPAHGRRGTLEKEASALVEGVKGRDALSHSGRDSATPSEGIPATGGVGGYLSREQEAPFTDQLSTSPRPQVDLSTSLASRTRKRGGREIADHLNGTAHSAGAHVIAKAYSDSCPSPVPGDLISKIAQAVDGCLKSGVSREQIEAGIQDWAASPMTAASMIPGFVHKAANRPAAPSDGGIGKATKKAMGWADMGNQLAQRQAEGLNSSTPKGITA